ncbi:hypothetical protein IH781_00220 [Patescibacteria group bacterium]|nr:hypothetical protein [Patescibacteria group bacterium]
MAGISRVTALEIFTQPKDLHFSVGEDGGTWGFAITRGPGHSFKPLLTAQPVFDDMDQAVKDVGDILAAICETCRAELDDKTSLSAQVLNPDNRSLEEATVLTAELIEWILQELRANRKVGTYEKASVS